MTRIARQRRLRGGRPGPSFRPLTWAGTATWRRGLPGCGWTGAASRWGGGFPRTRRLGPRGRRARGPPATGRTVHDGLPHPARWRRRTGSPGMISVSGQWSGVDRSSGTPELLFMSGTGGSVCSDASAPNRPSCRWDGPWWRTVVMRSRCEQGARRGPTSKPTGSDPRGAPGAGAGGVGRSGGGGRDTDGRGGGASRVRRPAAGLPLAEVVPIGLSGDSRAAGPGGRPEGAPSGGTPGNGNRRSRRQGSGPGRRVPRSPRPEAAPGAAVEDGRPAHGRSVRPLFQDTYSRILRVPEIGSGGGAPLPRTVGGIGVRSTRCRRAAVPVDPTKIGSAGTWTIFSVAGGVAWSQFTWTVPPGPVTGA